MSQASLQWKILRLDSGYVIEESIIKHVDMPDGGSRVVNEVQSVSAAADTQATIAKLKTLMEAKDKQEGMKVIGSGSAFTGVQGGGR